MLWIETNLLIRTQAKKKKKKPVASDAPTSPQQSIPAEAPKLQQPKSSKKGKGKEKKDGLDDLDTALAELSKKCV